jgi:hypothetical protein
MKRLLIGLCLFSSLLFADFDFQKDFGLLEWKSSEKMVNIAYEGLEEDPVFEDNDNIKVLSDYNYGLDIERISFYLYNNQLYKVEIVYNPAVADFTFLEGKVASMKAKYGIYSEDKIDEKIGFLRKKGSIFKWAKGVTLISLSGIDLVDELGQVKDSQLVETHEYYPISNEL